MGENRYLAKLIIVMVIITILMLIGKDKSPICLLCWFASYSSYPDGGVEQFRINPRPPLAVFVPYKLNFGSKDQRYKKEGPDPNKGSTQL